MTRVVSKSNNLAQRHSYRGGGSKPKISVNEQHPISSPRLKSFPAEKIKRIDSSSMRNNSETGNMPPSQLVNSGQGDSSSYSQNPQLPIALGNEKITCTSEPRVSQNIHAMENHVIHSESAIPSGRMVTTSTINSPRHRPYVHNVGHQPGIEYLNNLPTKFPMNVPHESPAINQEKISVIEKETVKSHDPWKIENEATKKVGREHEERFSQKYVSNVEPNLVETTIVPGALAAAEKSSNIMNLSQTREAVCPNGSTQIQQIPRPNFPHCYNVDNNNNVWMSGKGQYFVLNSGMTSPQDNAINQIKNCQRCLQLGKYICRQNQLNNWFVHNHARPLNELPPTDRSNVTQHSNHSIHPNVASGQHQNVQGHWHPPVQQQYYYRQIPSQTSNPGRDDIHEKSHFLQSGIPNQQQSHTSAVEDLGSPLQRISQAAESPGEVSQQQTIDEKLENTRNFNAKKNPLLFTPTMIRDQEMLIATMRQQSISEDAMRRQFDALLAEQRKQLLYLQQLRNPENHEKKSSSGVRVQRKVSKIEEDGKPEWMLHITPPWIPYSVVEKMQAERYPNSQVNPRNDRNISENKCEKQSSDQRNETYGHNLQEYHQHPGQMSGYYNCHQSQCPYMLSGHINAPQKEHQNYNPSNQASVQNQERYHLHPAHYSHQPDKLNDRFLVLPENGQSHENPDQKQQYQQPEKNAKTIEPSSLLKLRIQKDAIKRQKQNNGLQDAETIKEAMLSLKNPANRKGLEYLENLNSKATKPISLNGAQDPREAEIFKQQQPFNYEQPSKKTVSANGLENSRNPNNPLPRYIPRQRNSNEMFISEYPRQRNRHFNRNLTAERENGTVATTKHQNSNFNEKSDDQALRPNIVQKGPDTTNSNYPGYFQATGGCNDDKCLNSHPMPIPSQTPSNGDNICGTPCHDCMLPRSGYFTNQVPHIKPQRKSFDPEKNDLCEPVIIGGIKYLARKPEYFRSDIPSHHNSTNHERVFSPTLACH